ncbi:MAG: hypothetical protein U9O06_06485, partial [Euryarchaeota archaeon]|nr:hypothetical protein [Euryarchaeota archaeon]
MKRRNFVTGLCVGSIASVSGCMSGSGESGGGGEGPSNVQSTSVGVEVNVEEIEIGTAFESGGSTYEPEEDNMFVFARFRAENTADNAQPLPYINDIQLIAGSDQYDEYGIDFFSENNGIDDPVTGDRYQGEDDARSGVVSEGWLIFEIPRDTENIEISWAGGYEHDEFEASWEATLDSSQLPQIEGVEIEMADEVEVGDELEIQILAENSGGGEGTLSTEVQIEVPGKDNQRFETDLVIPGESSESESVTVSSAVLGEIVVNIEEYDTAV